MTEDEYYSEIEKLEKELITNKNRVGREYAFSNNPYKIGDTIKDHIGAMIITNIKYNNSVMSLPQCVYFGTELNKDGKPSKKQSNRGVWQDNIIK